LSQRLSSDPACVALLRLPITLAAAVILYVAARQIRRDTRAIVV
jgi:hypothetical protein